MLAQFLAAKLNYISAIPTDVPGGVDRQKKLSGELLSNMTAKLEGYRMSLDESTAMMNTITSAKIPDQYKDCLFTLCTAPPTPHDMATRRQTSAVTFQKCLFFHILCPLSVARAAADPRIPEDNRLLSVALTCGSMGITHMTERTRQHILSWFLTIQPNSRANIQAGTGANGMRLTRAFKAHVTHSPKVTGLKEYPATSAAFRAARPDICEVSDIRAPCADATRAEDIHKYNLCVNKCIYIYNRRKHAPCRCKSTGALQGRRAP